MKHTPVHITQQEYRDIIFEDDSLHKKLYDIYIARKPEAIQQHNEFYSKWGHLKIGLARLRKMMMDEKNELYNKIDWDKVDGEMLDDIDNLLERDIDPEWEIGERYGVNETNKLIIEFATELFNERKANDDYDDNKSKDGGLDDWDIIRRIQDGDGDRYGY